MNEMKRIERDPADYADRTDIGPEDGGRRIGAVRSSFGFFNRIVMAMDGVAVAGTSVLLGIAYGDGARPLVSHMVASLAVAAGVMILLQAISSYRIEHYRHLRRSLIDLLCGSLSATAILLLASSGNGGFAPLTVPLFARIAGTMLAALTLDRLIARTAYYRLQRKGFFRRYVAIIGDNECGRELAEHVLAQEESELRLVGLFSESTAPSLGILGGTPGIADLRRIAHHRHVDVIVLALPDADTDRIFRTAAQVQWISADIVTPVDTSRFMPDCLVRTAGRPMLLLASHPLRGSQGVIKLIEDYAIASTALLLASPFMLAAALMVLFCNDGPIIFRQRRMGVNGQPFFIWKFRTMSVQPDDDGSVAVERGDPRVTRVGAFLRRTSLDELPQLINVLRGEMSIVGPRPHVPGMLVDGTVYSDLVQTYAARHRLKPGITGWAQVNGMRAGITSAEIARRGVELDLHYIRNWSLKLDLDIMVRTVTANLVGRHIY